MGWGWCVAQGEGHVKGEIMDCWSRGGLTGPNTASSVTSRTFSIGALFGSGGGCLSRVGRSGMDDIIQEG